MDSGVYELSGEELISLAWNFLKGDVKISLKEASLDRVASKGYLYYEDITTFACDGPTYAILRCPSCGASELTQMDAWLHAECGSVTYEEGRCPKCGSVGRDELISIGPVYRCESCGEIVNYPLVDTICGRLKLKKYRMYMLTGRGNRLMSRIREALDGLPEPKALLVELSGVKMEALLLQEVPRGVILRSNDRYQEVREGMLRRLGLDVLILSF